MVQDEADVLTMTNELLLLLSIFISFSLVLLCFRFFRKHGLYLWITVATVLANIEVLLLVRAFGIEMTLGNVLFASTFLVTDILSELYGKQSAREAVLFGAAATVLFFLISQSWSLYNVLPGCNAQEFRAVFSRTPRVLAASLSVYVFVQYFDVWCYHAWWEITTRLCGDKRRFLWLRNNFATILSQLLNSVLFTLGAFYGVYGGATLVQIIVSSFAFFCVTSLADTPFLYLARKIYENTEGKSE